VRIAQLGTAQSAIRPGACPTLGIASLVLLIGVACSGDPAGPKAGDAPGSFTATFTGAINATLTGTATFVAQEGQGYEVEMQTRGSQSRTLWITAGDGRPLVRDYAITPVTAPQSLPTVVVVFCADAKATCFTRWGVYWETSEGAGRLVVEQSTTTVLAGKFEVDLRTDTGNVSGGGPLTHVSARFNATCRLASGC